MKIWTFLTVLTLFSCNYLSKNKTAGNGVQYTFIEKGSGQKIEIGKQITFNVWQSESKDFSDTIMTKPNHIDILFNESLQKDPLYLVLKNLRQGDSVNVKLNRAEFYNKPDSIYTNQNIINFIIKIVSVTSPSNTQAIKEEKFTTQRANDSLMLLSYFENKKIAPIYYNGIYYLIEKKGQGQHITLGDNLVIDYEGFLINDKKFYSTIDNKQAYKFHFQPNSVIKGWEIGLTQFSKGSSGTLFIPSHLAYGASAASNDIPANSVLIFNIRIL